MIFHKYCGRALRVVVTTSRVVLLSAGLCASIVGLEASAPPKLPHHLFGQVNRTEMKRWADSVYNRLSQEERVAQLIMPIIYPSAQASQIDLQANRVRQYGWGGILYQKGMLAEQAEMNDRLQKSSRVPMLIALDGEWGLYMRLKDAPRYPRNMGLGMNGDNQVLYNYGREIARQCRLMGIHVNFAPDVDVNINPRNPVIGTRSFGEDPKQVAERALAYAAGLEDGGVLSVAKHFPGHGDTSEDSHHTLPTVSASRKRMQQVELYPFAQYIKAGHGGVMTAHLNVPAYESGRLPSSLSPSITTDLLKREMNFAGLVFTDGLEMKGVTGGAVKEIGVQALLAGNDVLLGPSKPEEMLREIVGAVRSGRIKDEVLREKVIKVLCYKWRLIVSQPEQRVAPSRVHRAIWTSEAGQTLRQTWLASLYYLHQNPQVMKTLRDKAYGKIAVLQIGKNPASGVNRPQSTGKAGSKIDYFSWDALKSMAKLSAYDCVLVQVFSTSGLPTQALESLSRQKPVVVTYMTSPYKVAREAQWHRQTGATLIAFEAAKEAQEVVLSLLTGQQSLGSKPAEMPNTAEIDADDPTARTGEESQIVPSNTPKQERASFAPRTAVGRRVNLGKLAAIDELAQEGIRNGAYPGCQIFIAHRGQTIYNKAFGTLTGKVGSEPVQTEHLYDVASITKALAMTPVMMLLVSEGQVKLNATVGTYLKEFRGTSVGGIRVRDLLLHQSGLPAGLNFYLDLVDSTSYDGALIRYAPFPRSVRLVGKAWGNPEFKFLSEYISAQPTATHTQTLARGLYLNPQFKQVMMQRLMELEPKSSGRYRYSDLNFVLLHQIAERVSGQSLDELFSQRVAKPIKASVWYNPLQSGVSEDRIVPTQRDDFFRKQIIRGTVDDETAACLGGVSGNAGLFASASELSKICQLILDKGQWQGKQIIPRKTVEEFMTTTGIGGIRALGFDKPRQRGNSPAAESASPLSIGHYGFTGTAFWIDPEEGLIFIFLSNRTYPTRQNSKLASDRYRPRLHELLYDALD